MRNQRWPRIAQVVPMLLVAWIAFPSPVWADTLTVEPADGGGAIKAALRRASPGDILLLQPGTYRGGFKIGSSITLNAEPGVRILLSRKQSIKVENASDVALNDLNIDVNTAEASQTTQARLLVRNCEKVNVTRCRIACGPDRGVTVIESKQVKFADCQFSGTGKAVGLSFSGDQLWLTGSTLSGFGVAVQIDAGTGIAVTDNLFIRNRTGVFVKHGAAIIQGNALTGPGETGIHVDNGDVRVFDNSARGFSYGIFASAPAVGIVATNKTSGNDVGIRAASYGIRFVRNTSSYNRMVGILAHVPVIVRPEKGQMLEIEDNIISSNGGPGIGVAKTHAVRIRKNLLENNGDGVVLTDAQAEITGNTIVLNEATGISVTPGSYAAIDRNIIANNNFGIRRSQFAVLDSSNNVVFGHIGGEGCALTDNGFSKQDWMPLTDGQKMLVGVTPALDIKSKTDVNMDPRFVQLGRDYRLRKDSPVVKRFGANLPGAYPVVE